MTPAHHQDYLINWAYHLNIPILSINYRKAPEDPFPNGFNDCYDIYNLLMKTNGQIINMNKKKKILKF